MLAGRNRNGRHARALHGHDCLGGLIPPGAQAKGPHRGTRGRAFGRGPPPRQVLRSAHRTVAFSGDVSMSYRSNVDSVPLVPDNWVPQNPDEIDINNERELLYWTNELRISIGDLIWLVQKHGTSAEHIRAMVR